MPWAGWTGSNQEAAQQPFNLFAGQPSQQHVAHMAKSFPNSEWANPSDKPKDQSYGQAQDEMLSQIMRGDSYLRNRLEPPHSGHQTIFKLSQTLQLLTWV